MQPRGVWGCEPSEPVPGVVVTLHRNGVQMSTSTTDEEGRYRFLVLQAGEHDLSAAGHGLGRLAAIGRNNCKDSSVLRNWRRTHCSRASALVSAGSLSAMTDSRTLLANVSAATSSLTLFCENEPDRPFHASTGALGDDRVQFPQCL
jgi:hypothetical protein